MHIEWYLAAVFLMFRVVLKYSVSISTTIALFLLQDSPVLASETSRHANAQSDDTGDVEAAVKNNFKVLCGPGSQTAVMGCYPSTGRGLKTPLP